MLAPFRVMLADPVDARLARRAALAVLGPNENPRDLLPTRKPAVRDARLLPSTPNAAWHRAAVSEIHPVLSHAVCPLFSPTLTLASPTLPPYTVTLIDPEAAELPSPPLLSHPIPKETPRLALDTRAPADTAPRRLPDTPPPAWPLTDESDSHVVRSQELRPTLSAPQIPLDPKLAPWIVTLLDPDAAALAPLATLAIPDTNDTLRDALPILPPSVITAFLLPDTLAPLWHRMEVSASQLVLSHPVEPIRAPPQYVARPIFAPPIVTLMDPVDATLPRIAVLSDPPTTERARVEVPMPAPTDIKRRRLPVYPCTS